MSNKRTSFLTGLAALVASLPLAAQMATPAPSAAVAPAYRSAFEGYRSFEAGEVQDWRKSNDTVREVGGWRAYAREMSGGVQAPAPAASAPHSAPPQAAPKTVDPHAGHRQ